MSFRKIALVGVGLLGGSLALAIRERRLSATVQGFVRRDASVAECEQTGLRDFASRNLASVVRDADLIILCTPLAQMRSLVESFLSVLKPGAIVSDVGSVKATVVSELESLVASAGGQFIGAHPMAGAEKMGVSAARADLFRNAVCVLTPTSQSAPQSVEALDALWRALGARTLKLSPAVHDELVARCSHLPHVIAAELASLVLDPALPREQALLCANGFRDTTRIASGSPEMWRDIAVANRLALGRALDDYIQQLQSVRQAIAAGNVSELERFFATAKERRDAWCAQGASPSPE